MTMQHKDGKLYRERYRAVSHNPVGFHKKPKLRDQSNSMSCKTQEIDDTPLGSRDTGLVQPSRLVVQEIHGWRAIRVLKPFH